MSTIKPGDTIFHPIFQNMVSLIKSNDVEEENKQYGIYTEKDKNRDYYRIRPAEMTA